MELQGRILGRKDGCGARTQYWTTILSQLLAVHLEEDVVSDLGPPGTVDSPSAGCAAGAGAGTGLGHYRV